MKAQLIVALDVPDKAEAVAVLDRLPAEVALFKIGLELFCAEGPGVLEPFLARRKSIFLDLKLHDIPRTVERAVQAAARHGVFMLTVHASGGAAMLRAAADAARALGPQAPKIVAVTVLTSLDQSDLTAQGIPRTPGDQVLALARLALAAGVDGLVCSAQEVAALRQTFGPQPLLVTPGIRLPTDDVGDQKRVATPAAACRAGASYLVVGRPILESADPAAAARRILQEIP
ncbi:MAG: orotidine-5'-phosphate decarboxylase [Kiritimatiellaeota bacterium]|nr:orotidine-5'-phosphate decarboxylase [Kiritimatiellota bacterium]